MGIEKAFGSVTSNFDEILGWYYCSIPLNTLQMFVKELDYIVGEIKDLFPLVSITLVRGR